MVGYIALVVDDDEVARQFAVVTLKGTGFVTTVDQAVGGDEALEAMEARDYDLVLCDINMPGMTGLQLIERLKAKRAEDHRQMPLVVFMSSGIVADAYLEADHLGAIEFLSKPYAVPQVQNLVEILNRMRVPMKVLVVDDSHTVLKVVQKIFQRSTFNIVYSEADAGHVALEKIEQEKYDAIFVDVNMPGINGIQILAKIKSVHPKLKMVLMSSETLQAIKDRVGALHIDHFLHKPFSSHDVDFLLYQIFNLTPPRLHAKAMALRDAMALR